MFKIKSCVDEKKGKQNLNKYINKNKAEILNQLNTKKEFSGNIFLLFQNYNQGMMNQKLFQSEAYLQKLSLMKKGFNQKQQEELIKDTVYVDKELLKEEDMLQTEIMISEYQEYM
jgi:hypothetical protein